MFGLKSVPHTHTHTPTNKDQLDLALAVKIDKCQSHKVEETSCNNLSITFMCVLKKPLNSMGTHSVGTTSCWGMKTLLESLESREKHKWSGIHGEGFNAVFKV